jgi:hypothetical protein
MIESLFTSPAALGLSAGLVVTVALGFLYGPFLEKSVTIELPNQFEELRDAEKNAGGAQLGTLERLVFFASLWLPDAYVFGGGWLVFKLGAKWAAWQHIAKIPERLQRRNDFDYALERFQLSCRLLGRFLNGTLYNMFCAAVGVYIGKALAKSGYWLTDYTYWFLGLAVFALPVWQLIIGPLTQSVRSYWRKKK